MLEKERKSNFQKLMLNHLLHKFEALRSKVSPITNYHYIRSEKHLHLTHFSDYTLAI